MNKKYTFLDSGFVRLINHMGTDEDIVRCARQSYDDLHEDLDPEKTRRLIFYLMEHWHTSPFEMCEIQLEIQAPLFVVQQLLRHRTASLNQLSMRYTDAPDLDYLPELDRIQGTHKTNKQGSGSELKEERQYQAMDILIKTQERTDTAYRYLQDLGVANELARITLPASRYTRLVWKIDLHNLFHFLRLRLHPHAQYEIRVMAEQIARIARELWPVSYEAFEEFRLHSVSFSRSEMERLRGLLGGVDVDDSPILGSDRRGAAFKQKVKG